MDTVLEMRTFRRILITILILFPFGWFYNFDLDGTMNWALGRYEWPYQFNMALRDNWKRVGIEGYVFSYETHFPFIYVYGAGGFTKILNVPFIGYIEKLPNDSFYNQKGYGEKLSYADDTIDDMRKAYGSTLVIYTSFNDFSIHDQEIFRNMVINTKANDYRSPYNANAIQEGYINIIKVFKGLEALLGQKITI